MIKSGDDKRSEARIFTEKLVQTVRAVGGKVQVKCLKPNHWEVLDGNEHYVSPNHLSPAAFDYDCLLVFAFDSEEALHTWWGSEALFEVLKTRADDEKEVASERRWGQPSGPPLLSAAGAGFDPPKTKDCRAVQKLGIFVLEGLQAAFDILDQEKFQFGEKFMLVEFMNMQAFKPVQQYVDNFKRVSKRAVSEVGVSCNPIVAEGVRNMLMNEFPLDYVVATTWRLRSDAKYWYDSELYQKSLRPMRSGYTRSLAMLVPINDSPKSTVVDKAQMKAGMTALNILRK
jgi:uncharacterized protein (DUF1330 family)